MIVRVPAEIVCEKCGNTQKVMLGFGSGLLSPPLSPDGWSPDGKTCDKRLRGSPTLATVGRY